MKIVIAFLMAVLASVSGFSQEERPVNPVRILTAGQHIIPYKIEVTFGKTVHILFPSEVRYVDLGSNNIIAGKADGVENVVRVKAAVKEFPGETNFSVITGDGSFFSFNVVYKEASAPCSSPKTLSSMESRAEMMMTLSRFCCSLSISNSFRPFPSGNMMSSRMQS